MQRRNRTCMEGLFPTVGPKIHSRCASPLQCWMYLSCSTKKPLSIHALWGIAFSDVWWYPFFASRAPDHFPLSQAYDSHITQKSCVWLNREWTYFVVLSFPHGAVQTSSPVVAYTQLVAYALARRPQSIILQPPMMLGYHHIFMHWSCSSMGCTASLPCIK